MTCKVVRPLLPMLSMWRNLIRIISGVGLVAAAMLALSWKPAAGSSGGCMSGLAPGLGSFDLTLPLAGVLAGVSALVLIATFVGKKRRGSAPLA